MLQENENSSQIRPICKYVYQLFESFIATGKFKCSNGMVVGFPAADLL